MQNFPNDLLPYICSVHCGSIYSSCLVCLLRFLWHEYIINHVRFRYIIFVFINHQFKKKDKPKARRTQDNPSIWKPLSSYCNISHEIETNWWMCVLAVCVRTFTENLLNKFSLHVKWRLMISKLSPATYFHFSKLGMRHDSIFQHSFFVTCDRLPTP